ncbi:hypothetical protein MMC31_003489 [Peltigera leucophlebia]|nr:hypothetical protein [Peltigera leucophlebia]
MTPVTEWWAGWAAPKAAVLVEINDAGVEIADAGVTKLECEVVETEIELEVAETGVVEALDTDERADDVAVDDNQLVVAPRKSAADTESDDNFPAIRF